MTDIPDDVMKLSRKIVSELTAYCDDNEDAMTIARALMAEREAKWQPIETVSDEIKRNGTDVLLWYPDEDDPTESFMEVGCFHDAQNTLKEYRGWLTIGGIEPTHWMPRPQPPSGKESER